MSGDDDRSPTPRAAEVTLMESTGNGSILLGLRLANSLETGIGSTSHAIFEYATAWIQRQDVNNLLYSRRLLNCYKAL